MIFIEGGPLHNELNPKLWDSSGKLLPEVKDKLDKIVEKFSEYLNKFIKDTRFAILDVNLVGSNASYNYSDKSDLDVSVVINFNSLGTSDEIADDYFHCKKNDFNETYHPTIRGIDVELYVSDIKSVNISNGVYSVKYNKWIKKPVKIDPPKNVDVSDYTDEVESSINKTIETNDLEQLNKLMSSIYLMRRNSLIVNGEYGRGNLIYKDLRNRGALDKLHDAIDELTSDELSIKESFFFNESTIIELRDNNFKNKIQKKLENADKKYGKQDYKPVKSISSLLNSDKLSSSFNSSALINSLEKMKGGKVIFPRSGYGVRLYKFEGRDLLLIYNDNKKSKEEITRELNKGKCKMIAAYYLGQRKGGMLTQNNGYLLEMRIM